MESTPNSTQKLVTRLENGIALIDTKIAVTHDLYINGEVSGKIASNGKVVIDEKAVVNGIVIAKDVEIIGKLEGECYVKDQLVLHTGCVFTGKLSYGDIVSQSGAIVKGSFNKITEKEFDTYLSQDSTYQHLTAPAKPKEAPASPQPAKTKVSTAEPSESLSSKIKKFIGK